MLCAVNDIADGGAKGVACALGDDTGGVILLRQGARVRAYRNRCPHRGTPLETFPDRFLDPDTGLLVCSTHGARFRVSDGLCVAGPCKGERLEAVAVGVEGGQVRLLPAAAAKRSD
ncbi:MAG: Rieske (2Fe-2S) protein [Alphaproteobacteria bacterium]|nr:MAG: Rieske (2Fe-2S) protein [Alphaproteobacteria bacterium]